MANVENDSLRETQEAISAQPSPTSDAQLLRLMQTGDADAWQQLYKRYLPSAWRLAWQLVGDHQVAEDLVAESLLALCRRASELDPDNTKLFGWLRGVIRHKAMDHHRFKSRTSAALNQRALLQESTDARQQLNNRPWARLEQSEQVADVLEVLEELDETKQQCLQWKYLERISVREIAARLDITEKAVESILYRARLEFRERFEQLEKNSDSDAHVNHSQSIEPSDRSSD